MSRQSEVTRRGFMRDAAKVAAGVAGGATVARADVYKRILPQTVMGANEKIRTVLGFKEQHDWRTYVS